MDNPANNTDDQVQPGEVSPGVTPIHDEAAAAVAVNQDPVDEDDEDDVDDDEESNVTSHNVFEQTEATSTESLEPERSYEGGCAS